MTTPSKPNTSAGHVKSAGQLEGLVERVRATPRLVDALAECHRYTNGQNRIYWWRRASMGQLAALGLVETHTPPSMIYSRGKQRPYRLTDLGRSLLTALATLQDGGGE